MHTTHCAEYPSAIRSTFCTQVSAPSSTVCGGRCCCCCFTNCSSCCCKRGTGYGIHEEGGVGMSTTYNLRRDTAKRSGREEREQHSSVHPYIVLGRELAIAIRFLCSLGLEVVLCPRRVIKYRLQLIDPLLHVVECRLLRRHATALLPHELLQPDPA